MTTPIVLEELARKALAGDRDALDAMVRALQGDIYGLALRMLWNREDAEDATQEILVRIVTRLSQFGFRSRLKTWAYRLAVNYILDVKKSATEQMHLSFERFADYLDEGREPVNNCNYVWTAQGGASALADASGRGGRQSAPAPAQPQGPVEYRVVASYFANNRRLAGSGTGARLEYTDIDPSFLKLTATTTTQQAVEFERDSTLGNYLHPVAGSEAATIGAGLFTKPRA